MLVIFSFPTFAAEVNVSNEGELRTAVQTDGNTINLTGNIVLISPLEIKDKTLTINGAYTISPSSTFNTTDIKSTMIILDNSTITFNDVTLDGKGLNRIIYTKGSSPINLINATVKNGKPGENATQNPGRGILLSNRSNLTATNTNFLNNTPGTNINLSQYSGERDKNGGSIYSVGADTVISITGGKFEGNRVGEYGHGAAIYIQDGTLNISGTTFADNSGHYGHGDAGTQGANIYIKGSAVGNIHNVTVDIAKGFNTGGFLRSLGSNVDISNSTFNIKSLGTDYGISGGALCFEGGTSTVANSTFTIIGKSMVSYAGGFIDIVGGETHTIDNNTMTGIGRDNGQGTANFDGAICIEEKLYEKQPSPTVYIKNNTIKDLHADIVGGAIAIGTKKR